MGGRTETGERGGKGEREETPEREEMGETSERGGRGEMGETPESTEITERGETRGKRGGKGREGEGRESMRERRSPWRRRFVRRLLGGSRSLFQRVAKPSVSSIIAAPEVDKRPPPKDLNMPSRLILSAVKQAVDDANDSSNFLRSVFSYGLPESPTASRKVVKPGPRSARMDEEGDVNVTIVVDGSKATKKRGSWEKEEAEEIDSKKAKQIKCQFWPNCKRGESCIYHHPKERCK